MSKRKLNRSVFLILLCIFIAVITPMYILCYGIYQWGKNLTTNEITQSLNAHSRFFISTLEDEIARIKQQQYECLNDDNLFYLANAWGIMSKFEQVSYMLSVQKRLQQLYNSSAYIANVNLWIPNLNRTISAKSGVGTITSEWEHILAATPDASPAGIVYLDNELYILSAYPSVSGRLNSAPLYILAVKLSSDNIRKQMMSFNMYEKGGVVLSNSDQNYQSVVGNDIGLDMQIFEKKMDDKTFRGSDGEKYLLVNNYSDYLNMDLSSYVSERLIYSDLYHYRNLFLLFTGVAIVMVTAYLVSANMFINRPIKLLVKSLVKVEQGELDVRIQHKSNDEFGYLYSAFNRMLDSLDEMIEQNYRQKMLTQDAELRQLQSQINPHFLYNSFFILYRMAKDEDYENITEFLTYLSDYYRYITRNALSEVPLTDEVNHARKYAQIQFIRFRKRLSIDFEDLPRQFNNLMVPRLILQPLLENAFNHGLKDVASDGLLKVSFEEKADTLVIKVEDNGEGVGKEEFLRLQQRLEQTGDMEETTGLLNINKRLQLKFGKEYGLRLVQPETGGMCSELLLPLNKDKEEENDV